MELKARAVISSLNMKRDLNVIVVVEPERLTGKQKLNEITHKNNCKYLRKISCNAFGKALFALFQSLNPPPKIFPLSYLFLAPF